MEVKVYTTPTCGWCKKLKEWLKKKNVSYQELNVIESDQARDELIDKSGQISVPVTDIDGEIIVGFNEAKFEEIIKRKKGK